MKTLIFEIDSPQELSAGLRGFTDTITITVDSGDAGGEEGEFEKYIQNALLEWYDGATVTPVFELKHLEDGVQIQGKWCGFGCFHLNTDDPRMWNNLSTCRKYKVKNLKFDNKENRVIRCDECKEQHHQ